MRAMSYIKQNIAVSQNQSLGQTWKKCEESVRKIANINNTQQSGYMFITADFRIFLETLDYVEILQSKLQQNK